MSYDSIRNKKLVEFPNGKLMLICEISSSNVRDAQGKRCWDKFLIHDKGSLFFTKDSLKKKQNDYVEQQFKMRRTHNEEARERGYVDDITEPSLESYDFFGTVFPGGSKVKNGKAFYSGRKTIKAEEYFAEFDSPRRIRFTAYDGNFKRIYEDSYDILRADLDECYRDLCNSLNAQICISLS